MNIREACPVKGILKIAEDFRVKRDMKIVDAWENEQKQKDTGLVAIRNSENSAHWVIWKGEERYVVFGKDNLSQIKGDDFNAWYYQQYRKGEWFTNSFTDVKPWLLYDKRSGREFWILIGRPINKLPM